MTADIEAAVSVRWRFEDVAYASSDLVRVRDTGVVTLALLANGGESSFSTFWPSGSRLLLDAFDRAWDVSEGTPEVRLGQAFETASADFCSEAAALVPPDDDIPGDHAYGTLLAVVVAGSRVEVAWVGGAKAVLVRGRTAEAWTRPHTFLEQLRNEGMGPPWTGLAGAAPGILSRSIGSTSADEAGAERASFEMLPGDTIVLLSSGDFREPAVSPQAVAAMVGGESDVGAAVSAVVSGAYTNGEPPFAAAATLHRRPR